ncbi:MAG TPA: hypothetical protein VIG96_00765 [Blastococcus sp.]
MTGGPPGPEPEVGPEPDVAAGPTPSLATEVAVPLDERIEAIEDEIVVVGMGIAVPGASDPRSSERALHRPPVWGRFDRVDRLVDPTDAGTVVRFKGGVPDTSAWRPAVR